LVERPLAVGRVAVAVAGVGLLDVLVGNASVGERLLPRLLGPVRVVALLGAGLLELGHPDPDHERPLAQSSAPLVCRARTACLAGWPGIYRAGASGGFGTGSRASIRGHLPSPGLGQIAKARKAIAIPIAVPAARWPAARSAGSPRVSVRRTTEVGGVAAE